MENGQGRPSGEASDVRSQPTLVYLVRHGLTSWNADRRFQGQADVPLNEEGRAQARAVAEWLEKQGVRFTAIYSSDLSRAAETARAIGERLHIEPQYSPALREINVGDWQGLLFTEVNERYPGHMDRWYSDMDNYTLPNGENVPQLQARIARFYKQVIREHKGEGIIIVSHGMALAALRAAIHAWGLTDTFNQNRARLGNTGVTALQVDAASGAVEVLHENSTEHLDRPTGLTPIHDQPA